MEETIVEIVGHEMCSFIDRFSWYYQVAMAMEDNGMEWGPIPIQTNGLLGHECANNISMCYGTNIPNLLRISLYSI